jgi:uncharacterized OB-fold protein
MQDIDKTFFLSECCGANGTAVLTEDGRWKVKCDKCGKIYIVSKEKCDICPVANRF